MSMRKAALAGLLALSAHAGTPGLGQPIGETDLARLPRSVFPDGRGLPQGRGSVAEGRVLFDAQCAACHGKAGVGGSGGHLVSDGAIVGPDPDAAVNTYWPYATTLWDFTRRAMPMNAPGSLTADQTYAVTAYLLHLSGLIAADATVDQASLPAIRMPNRDGFDWIDVAPPRAGR